MRRPHLLPAVVLLLGGLVLCLAQVPSAGAGEKKKVKEVEWSATVEPADLAPGGEGWLVVRGRLTPPYHIYAAGDEATTWRELPAEGVTYDLEHAEASDAHPWKPEWGGEEDVKTIWEGEFVLRVPLKLAPTVRPGTEVGLLFDYQACSDRGCLVPERNHKVSTWLPGAEVPAPILSPAVAYEGGEVRLEVKEVARDGLSGLLQVVFEPAFNHYFYLPPSKDGSIPIDARPVAAEGVTWGAFALPAGGGKLHDALAIDLGFERSPAVGELAVEVRIQACDTLGRCLPPRSGRLTLTFDTRGAAPTPTGAGPEGPEPTEAGAAPEEGAGASLAGPAEPRGELFFPVYHSADEGAPEEGAEPAGAAPDAPGAPAGGAPAGAGPGPGGAPVPGGLAAQGGSDDEAGLVGTWYRESGLLVLGLLFLVGVGLAFTPCVLPIIPITISVIGGGRAVPKGRLTALLGTYVGGLTLTYGGLGVFAAFVGGSMSAAFREPLVIVAISGLFFFLALAMLGVFELQPPQWLARLQGGAQRRAGSYVGAFMFGCLAAVIASPCTGPFIAGMALVAAQQQDPVLGFSMFAALALGMGAVFFAAGSLNLLMRPGPWMVWVRYGFGVILFGAAIYYLANQQLIVPPVSYALAGLGALIGCLGIARHLRHREGAEPREAWRRGVAVGSVLALAGLGVAFLTRPIVVPEDLRWTKIRDKEHLLAAVEDAAREGRPVVVDVWATWCYYCKEYDKVMLGSEALKERLRRVVRLKLDVTDDMFPDIRQGLGIPADAQPYLVFIDPKKRIHRGVDIQEWWGDQSEARLKQSLDRVLGVADPALAGAAAGAAAGAGSASAALPGGHASR